MWGCFFRRCCSTLFYRYYYTQKLSEKLNFYFGIPRHFSLKEKRHSTPIASFLSFKPGHKSALSVHIQPALEVLSFCQQMRFIPTTFSAKFLMSEMYRAFQSDNMVLWEK